MVKHRLTGFIFRYKGLLKYLQMSVNKPTKLESSLLHSNFGGFKFQRIKNIIKRNNLCLMKLRFLKYSILLYWAVPV